MSSTGSSPGFLARLIDGRVIAERTMAFRLEKPSGWTFKPGQFVDLTLLDPPQTDAEGNTRTFSITSSPGEPFLMVATRMRDTAFKRVLRDLAPGVTLKIDGPYGSLVLHG